MNEEEKKAIERLERIKKGIIADTKAPNINIRNVATEKVQAVDTVLNLITKLLKENETTCKLNANMSKRHLNDIFKIKNYEKQIGLMAEYMEENMDEYQLDEIYSKQYNRNGMERNWTRGKEKEIKDIKQYFEKLAKENMEI